MCSAMSAPAGTALRRTLAEAGSDAAQRDHSPLRLFMIPVVQKRSCQECKQHIKLRLSKALFTTGHAFDPLHHSHTLRVRCKRSQPELGCTYQLPCPAFTYPALLVLSHLPSSCMSCALAVCRGRLTSACHIKHLKHIRICAGLHKRHTSITWVYW